MDIAALITWVVTAILGFTMLATWLARGGLRPPGEATVTTGLVPPLILSHFLLAAAGLVIWIIYVINDATALAWIAFAILILVAILGEAMFLRWRRTRTQATPESRFPVAVVYLHGLFAVATLVLVFLAAIGIGDGNGNGES